MSNLQTQERPATSGATNDATAGTQRETFVTPTANILETTEGYVLEAEMPGVAKDGIEVTVQDGELVIVGRRVERNLPGTPLYRESRQQNYRRVFDLDPSIDTSKITAKMEQGILLLTLPKAEEVKPRRIEVTD
jgi:HSP20 family protein